jgi:hypothetical protein
VRGEAKLQKMPLKPRESNFFLKNIHFLWSQNQPSHAWAIIFQVKLQCRNHNLPLDREGGEIFKRSLGKDERGLEANIPASPIIGLGRLVTSYIGELPIQPLSYLFLTQPQQNLKEFSAHRNCFMLAKIRKMPLKKSSKCAWKKILILILIFEYIRSSAIFFGTIEKNGRGLAHFLKCWMTLKRLSM